MVLILMAILLVAIVSVIALALDVTKVETSHSQQRHIAEFAALGALEEYKDTIAQTVTGTETQAMMASVRSAAVDAALTKAKDISGLNFIVGQPHVAQDDLCFASNSNCAEAQDRTGWLQAGEWHFVEPESCGGINQGSCPCEYEGGEWKGPCFKESDVSNPNQPINAFALSMRTRHSTPINNSFGAVFGQPASFVTTRAVASVIPRRVIFGVDLTGSMAYETHLNRPNQPKTRFAYKLLEINGAPPTAADCNGSTNPCPTKGVCRFAGSHHSSYNSVFIPRDDAGNPLLDPDGNPIIIENLPDTRPSEELPPTEHFKSDYRCHTVTYNVAGSGQQTEYYLIDRRQYRNPGLPANYYRGPEPLTTVVNGLRQALIGFENRSVAGDMVGIRFFDREDQVIIERTFPLMAPVPSNAMFTNLRDAVLDIGTPTASNPTYPTNLVTNFLFPRQGASTNFPDLLANVLTELSAQQGFGVAANSVVLISDALTNCVNNAGGGFTPAGGSGCNNNYKYFNGSMNFDVLAGLVPIYKNELVNIHMMLMGAQVGPFTLNIQNADCAWITDKDAREHGVNFVSYGTAIPYGFATLSDWFNGMSVNAPFHEAAVKAYQMTVETNGFFWPIRPAGGDPDGDGIIDEAWTGIPREAANLEQIVEMIEANPGDPDSWEAGLNGKPSLIQRYDPLVRSPDAQVLAAMAELLAQNTYLLVE